MRCDNENASYVQQSTHKKTIFNPNKSTRVHQTQQQKAIKYKMHSYESIIVGFILLGRLAVGNECKNVEMIDTLRDLQFPR